MLARALAIALSFSLLSPSLVAAAPSEQAAPCQFVLGFARLRALIGPEVVGECVENEHAGRGGDSVQRTTKGTMVWRRVDNVTAFTDGHRTWLNGPKGLQSRLNTELLDWERQEVRDAVRQAAKPNLCTPATIELAPVPFDPPTGPHGWVGFVTNRCSVKADVVIDVVGRSKPGDDASAPVAEIPSVAVIGIEPGARKPLAVSIPEGQNAPYYSWHVTPLPSGVELVCLDVGASRCLATDPVLADAALALLDDAEGAALVRRAADGGVGLIRAGLPRGLGGVYAPPLKVLVVSRRFDRSTRWMRAVVLAHELQHAADHLDGRIPDDGHSDEAACYASEVRAFSTEGRIWTRLWAGKPAPETNPDYAEQNQIAQVGATDPARLAEGVQNLYKTRCGHIAPDPSEAGDEGED